MRALLAVTPLLVACSSGSLSSTSGELLGCHAAVRGALTARVDANEMPHAGAFFDGADSSITLYCSSDADPHTRLQLAAPAAAGAFDAQATLLTHTIGETDDIFYGGVCSGMIDQSADSVGDWLSGSFACARLSGLSPTNPSQFVTVSDGTFDLQLQQPTQR